MKDNDLYSPTYLDILNLFYANGFPSILGHKATAVALGIVHKWNSLYRPAEFVMANSELCHLSGVEFNIERSRQRVCDLCKVNGIPLFTYVSNGTKRAGTYKINGNLTANKRQFNGNLTEYYQRSQSKRSESEILKEKEKKKKKSFWDFTEVVYDRYKPPEEMYRLEHALNEIYPMSNLWIEDDFDNLQFLMENFEAEEVIAVGKEAKESGVNCNSALAWIVEKMKEAKHGTEGN